MAIYDGKWFEIWFSEGSDITPYYLLIVTQNEQGKIEILDPYKNNKVVLVANNYEEATSWLREDEFEIAEGRMFPDDGW